MNAISKNDLLAILKIRNTNNTITIKFKLYKSKTNSLFKLRKLYLKK